MRLGPVARGVGGVTFCGAGFEIAARHKAARHQRGGAIKRLLRIDEPRLGFGQSGTRGSYSFAARTRCNQGRIGAALLRGCQCGLRLACARRAIDQQQHLPGADLLTALDQHPGNYAVGKGLFYGEILRRDGEEKESTLFLLPPRYNSHEQELATVLGFKEVVEVGILKRLTTTGDFFKSLLGLGSKKANA